MRIEIYRAWTLTQGKVWRWRAVAQNGNILASGEGYKRRIDMEAALTALRLQFPLAPETVV